MPRSQLKSLKGQGKNRQNINQQLITGRVYDVILDKNHPFFERKLGGIFDASYIGTILWGDLNLKIGSNKIDTLSLDIAKPLNNSITYIPLKYEIVTLTFSPSPKHYAKLGGYTNNVEYYYHPPINVWNNSSYNPLPKDADTKFINKQSILYSNSNNGGVNEEPELTFGDYIKEDALSNTKNMVPFEGDMIFEGRFGNSIRFGSSNPRGKNNWSENQNISNINLSSNNLKSLDADFSEQQTSSEIFNNFSSDPPPLNSSTTNTGNINDPFSESVEEYPNQGDDNTVNRDDLNTEPEGGYEDLVKFPGKYRDNSKNEVEVYLLPKRFSNGTVFITSILKNPLMKMLLDAEDEGIRLIVNSGFRPPVDTIKDKSGKVLQVSQKDLRLKNLKSQYKDKIKEPWLKNSLVTQPFGGFSPGQKIKLSPQKTYFTPVTAPSFRSGHGASSAVDFSTASATNEQYRWLAKNGWFYGFIRVVKSEPWHFKYSPGDAQKGPTAILPYKYEPGKSYDNTLNRWNILLL